MYKSLKKIIMRNTALIAFALLLSLNTFSQKQNFFGDKVDAEGWFSFNQENNAYIRNQLDNQTLFLIHPEVQKNKNHATWYALNFTGAALATQTPIIGGIYLPNSFKADGTPGIKDYSNNGSVVFKLPSCTTFQLLFSTNARFAFVGVYTSTDGIKYKTISEPGVKATADISSDEDKVGQFVFTAPSTVHSKKPIYVKISNASAQALIIHKALITLN
jgi:hypothetical protein